MNVTVIGTGSIGSALGTAFARAGHHVTFGVRDPDGARPESIPPDVERTDIASAVSTAEVVVLAVPGPAVPGLLAEHAAGLAGRLVVDATNTLSGGPANRAQDVLAVPGARYARAFNSLGVENLLDPNLTGEQGDMVFSCPQSDRDVVASLIDAVGLRPVWVGEDAADVVDGVLRLWFALARIHGRQLAFRVLTTSTSL